MLGRLGALLAVGILGTGGIALAVWWRTSSEPDRYATWGMALIRGGRFVAGALDLATSVEGPGKFALQPREVEVATFAIDRTEVTVEAYALCVNAGACSPAGDAFRCSAGSRLGTFSGLPVTCVQYAQAESFCRWSGKRLPTEIEWEYAARGEQSRTYPWGEKAASLELMCSRQAEPCPVASRPAGATPEGVFDLAGNVWEWTQSDHCGQEVANCNRGFKIVKGGPLVYERDQDQQARSAFRHSVRDLRTDWDLGFRCVADPGAGFVN